MTEFYEGSFVPEPEPAEEEIAKDPLKIRIALFYDGTLNNRVNIGEREADTDNYHEFRTDEPNSYDNGRTNIAIMEPHIEETADNYDVFLKHYIEGQGTLDLQGDSFKGYALGGGESGVADRAVKGIEKAVNLILNSGKVNSEEHYIEKLTIDVFGFSRGAATARYAIHVLFNGRRPSINEHTNELVYEYEPIHTSLINWGYDIEAKVVEVCFAGLYDTVLSYYGSQYFKRANNVLQQKAVARAKKALHLAAADEHRLDFPLHNIKSAKSKGGEEYFLPGVHSDIGGSYNQANEKALEVETDESKKVYMETTDEDMVILEGKRKELEQDMQDLIQQGWYKTYARKDETVDETIDGVTDGITCEGKDEGKNQEIDEIKVESRQLRKKEIAGIIPYPSYTNRLKVNRKNIRSAYCNIPLKIMAEYARKPDVNLTISSELEDRAEIILAPEKDLQKLEGVIRKYIASNKNSKPGDWIDDKAPLNDFLKKLDIRHRHFHFSSKPGAGYAPRIVFDKKAKKKRRARYEYDA